jgi:molecular chaperone DnaJ
MTHTQGNGMAQKDLYAILGVSKTAADAEIKKAYHKLALKYHPDSAEGDKKKAEERFKEISAAYDILKDPKKRQMYDQMGPEAFSGGGGNGGFRGFQDFAGADFSSIFEDLFSDVMGGRSRGGRSQASAASGRGQDIHVQIDMTLEQAFTGWQPVINFSAAGACESCKGSGSKSQAAPVPCATCRGQGTVHAQRAFFVVEQACPQCQGVGTQIKDPCTDCKGAGRRRMRQSVEISIPAGMEDEASVRLSGKGEAGVRGGPAGDLYVQVRLKPHEVFTCREGNLFLDYPISMDMAALGGEVPIPTLEGKTMLLTIPAGTQYGEQLVLKGQGMPVLGRKTRGNLYVKASIYTPVNLTVNQKDLLKAFQADSLKNATVQADGFLGKIKKLLKSWGASGTGSAHNGS